MTPPLLLDTQALVWYVEDLPALGRQARIALVDADVEGRLYISAISFWEIGALHRKRRLTLSLDLFDWRDAILRHGVIEQPLTGGQAIFAERLEGVHPDPADRMITATAQLLGLVLVTSDSRILDWKGELKRLDARR
jgi:PIN domain nuclease of toxin-antitoxin system